MLLLEESGSLSEDRVLLAPLETGDPGLVSMCIHLMQTVSNMASKAYEGAPVLLKGGLSSSEWSFSPIEALGDRREKSRLTSMKKKSI